MLQMQANLVNPTLVNRKVIVVEMNGSEHNTSDSDSESTHQPIARFLNDWPTKHNISRIAVNELMASLQLFHKSTKRLQDHFENARKPNPSRDFHKICRICTSFQDALGVKISLYLLKGLWSYGVLSCGGLVTPNFQRP